MRCFLIAIAIILAFVLGILVTGYWYYKKSSGTIRVDQSDTDSGPYLFLELTESPIFIKKRKYVVFKVNAENFISQK